MKKMEWYRLLPSDLLQSAYKSGNESSFELAWPKEEALRLIDWVNAKGLTVSAIEPWLPTKPGPMPLIFDWNAKRHASSDKMPNTPQEFIQQFERLHPLKEGQEPVFNFSVKSK